MYSDSMAEALQNFDQNQGIYNPIDDYKKALHLEFYYQILGKRPSSNYGLNEYKKILFDSVFNCN